MADNLNGENGIIARFPFVMVMTTTLLRGGAFFFLNLPLINPVLNRFS